MLLRKLLSASVALCVAAQPTLADTSFYYRNVTSAPVGAVNAPPPDASPDSVAGTGDLRVFAPQVARGRPGVPLSLRVTASNAQGPVAWDVAEGALPAGIGLGPDGVISGSPTAVGSATFAVVGKDARGNVGTTKAITLSISPLPAVSVASAAIEAGKGALVTPEFSGTLGSTSWSLAGTLPLGLTLDPATGAISGSTRQAGTFDGYALTVQDSDGASGTSAPFSLTVTSKIAISGVRSYYPVRVGGAFAGVVPQASGNEHPLTWEIATGTLPAGLALDPATGAITGMPTATGRSGPIALLAKDTRSGDSVVSPSFAVELAPAPTLTAGAAYATRTRGGLSIAPKATGLLSAGRWILDDGALPPGFEFSPAYGSIAGGYPKISRATVSGLRVRVIDLFDGAQASTDPIRIEVRDELVIQPQAVGVGTVGTPFSIPAPVASNLVGRPTWSANGIPQGMAIDPATGAITGKPTMAGRTRLVYALTDGFDNAQASTYLGPIDLTIQLPADPVALAVRPLQDSYKAITGRSFVLTPASQGVKGTATWSAATLPDWAGFDSSTGTLSGVPPTAGRTDGIVLGLTDGATGETAYSAPFGIATRDPIAVEYPPATAATQGVPVLVTPTVAAAEGATSFYLAAGRLPQGLAIDAATGRIAGTAFEAGDYANLVVSASDAATQVNSAPFRIGVAASAWTVSVPANPSAAPNVAFSLLPSRSGFPVAPRWSLVTGTLPASLALDAATGEIRGTPTAVGVYENLTLQADDGQGHVARTKAFTLGVYEQRLLAASLPAKADAFVGTPYTVTAQATNALPPLSWEAVSKPAWLALDTATGTLSGTPPAGGSASVVLSVIDGSGHKATTEAMALTSTASALAMADVASVTVPFGERFAGAPLSVSGASGTPTFALVSGTLPAGLSISASTGAVTGTATAVASVDGLVVEVTDGSGTKRRTNAFGVAVPRPALLASGPTGTLAANVGTTLSTGRPVARGAVGAQTWSATGLPGWLTLDPATGALSGKPTATGQAGPIVLTVADAYDQATASATAFTIRVSEPLPSTTTPGAASVSVSNAAYLARVSTAFTTGLPTVAGLGTVASWSVAGTLPAGLRLDPATGAILGTPTAPAQESLALTATDAAGKSATSAAFTIQVSPQPQIALQVPAVRANAPFQATPTVSGLAGSPIYTLSSNAPSWVRFEPRTGTLSGTAGPAGTTSGINLKVTDTDGSSAVANFSITVGAGISVTGLQASYPGRIGKPIGPIVPGVANARGAVSWQVAEKTTLIPGLSLAANGAVSGSPSSGGTVSVTATDASDGARATATYALALAQPLAFPGDLSLKVHEGIPASTPLPAIQGQRGSGIAFALTAGQLPYSASFRAATGQVSLSNPAVGLTQGLVITGTDPFDQVSAQTSPFSIEVVPTPYVDGMATSYVAQYGKPFQMQPPTLRNAIGAVTWTVSGQLPAWAYQRPDGAIASGANPNAFATTNLTMVGTDATGVSGSSAPFTLKVISQPAVSLSAAVAKTRIGMPVSVTASTNGTAASETWSYLADAGALPAGIAFDAGNARVAGTPTATGSASFRFHVEDEAGSARADSQQVQLSVSPPLTLAMSDGAAPDYVTRINAFRKTGNPVPAGAVGILGYALSPPAPDGMAAFPADGSVLSGAPVAPFAKTTFTATATDAFDGQAASTSFTLTALDSVRVAGTADLVVRSGADIGARSFAPQAQNLTDPARVGWSLGAGTLPPGITVSPTSGSLVGTAGAVAAVTDYAGIQLRATDADGTSGVNATPFKVTVAPALAVAAATTAYDARYGIARTTGPVTVTGKVSPNPVLSVVTKSGTGPTSKSAPAADGSFTFTPDTNVTPTWTYVIRAVDADGTSADGPVVTVTTTSNPQVAFAGPTQQVYQTSYQVVTPTITNTSGALTISWNAAPPTWIGTPNAATGAFTVNPGGVTAGSYGPYRLNVKDATGQIGSANISFTVVANTLSVSAPTSGATLQWHSGSPYAYQATATGATGTVTWSRIAPGNATNGNGPSNLTVSASGALGLNQASTLAATNSYLYAIDSSGQYLLRTFNAQVVPALGLALSASALAATEGLAVGSVTGTPANAIGTGTWTIEGGPPGVTISAAGVLGGAPSAGTSAPGGRIYNALVRLVDAAGGNVTQPLAITVNPPPVLAFGPVQNFAQDGLAASACQDVSLANTGQGTANGIALAVSSTEFALCAPAQAPACGTTLDPGATCYAGVRLSGTSSGSKNANLTATPTNGAAALATLYGTTANVVARGSYLVASGSGSFALPRAGMAVRVLYVGGGASGGSPSASYTGGSSGVVASTTITNAPASISYTVGTGGSPSTAAASTPGGATTVSYGGTTLIAAGGTGSSGGSGNGGRYNAYNSYGGASGGASGTAGGTGQGTGSFAAALSIVKNRTVSAGGGGGGYGGNCTSGCFPYGSGGGGGVNIAQSATASENGPGTAAAIGGGRGSSQGGTGGGGYGAGGGGSSYDLDKYGYPVYTAIGGAGAAGAFYVEWDTQ